MCVNSPVCPFSAFGASSVGQGNPWVHLPTGNFIPLLLNYSTHCSTKTELALNMFFMLVLNIGVLFNWQIWFKVEHGIFITRAPNSCMRQTCSWLQHSGVRTSQTRSHYGAGQTFHACLHEKGQSIILVNHVSLSEELLSMRRVSGQGHDSAILECSVTAELHFHHSIAFLLC